MSHSVKCVSFVLLSIIGCASSVTSSSGDAGVDDASVASDSSTPPRGPTPCAFDNPADLAAVVLAVSAGPMLRFVRADGTSFVAHTFGAGRSFEPASVFVRQLVVRGSYLAAATWSHDSRWSEVALFHRSGRLLWSTTRDFEQAPSGGARNVFSTLTLNAQGTLAFGNYTGSGDGIVVRPDGSTSSLPRLMPLGEASSAGMLPAQSTDGTWSGWVDLATSARRSLSFRRTQDFTAPTEHAGRLIYQGVRDSVPVVVSASPSEAQIVALPGEAVGRLGMMFIDRRGRMIFGAPYTTPARRAIWRVDFSRGEVTQLRLQLPSSQRLFAAGEQQLSVNFDDEGAPLLGLRDAYVGGLFRSEDFGLNWTRLGAPTRNVLGVVGSGREGTWLIQGTQNPATDSFVRPHEEWPGLPAGAETPVAPDAVQFVRPSDGAQGLLTTDRTSQIVLGGDGRCALVWEYQLGVGATFHARDLVRDRAFELTLAQPPTRAGTALAIAAAWIQ